MDWSATLSLTTSHARTHRANYGSFIAAAPLKRHGSGSTISIPESIPEHQCVDQFATPHLDDAEVPDRFDILGSSSSSSSTNYSSSSSSKTLTITETSSGDATRLQTFKMMLTSPSSSRINGGHAATARAASDDPYAPHDPHDPHDPHGSSAAVASSYWLQERERMRLLRDKRHRTRNGSPTKAATLRDDDDQEASQYRTVAIMCSVPLVLVIVFVVLVLVFGDGTAAVAADAAGAIVLSVNANAPPASALTTHLRSGVPDVPAPPAFTVAADRTP